MKVELIDKFVNYKVEIIDVWGITYTGILERYYNPIMSFSKERVVYSIERGNETHIFHPSNIKKIKEVK